MYTTFPSLAAWAKSLGSTARTRPGQIKAIRASFKTSTGMRNLIRRAQEENAPALARGPYAHLPRRADEEAQRQREAHRQRERQQRFAAHHPLTLSMPPPARQQEVAPGRPVSLSTLEAGWKNAQQHARCGAWCISLYEVVSWDNTRYSKTWHRAHGGVRVVERRIVRIRRVKEDGTEERRDVEVDAWRGHYLLNALVQAGITGAHKVPTRFKNVQLHTAFDVRVVREGTLSVYERTLCGEFYDVCVLWHGITYHAPTLKEAVSGLRRKLHAVLEATHRPVNWELGKRLGFCEDGMRTFAREFDLDVQGSYAPEEIARRVMARPKAAQAYRQELGKLAEAVNYPLPEGF